MNFKQYKKRKEKLEIYERVKNSPQVKRSAYTRRVTGILIIPLMTVSGILAFLVERAFHVSGYVTCTIAGTAAIAVAVLLAEKMANKKFGGK